MAHFTRSQFELVAATIKSMDAGPSTFGQWSRDDIAKHFADAFEKTNEAFNRARFLSACLK